MINIQLKETGNPLRDKIERIRLHRLNLLIMGDIEKYFENYNRFIFRVAKNDIGQILDKYGIEYDFQYDYDRHSDNVKIFIGKNYVLDIKITTDSEFHI